MDAKETLVNEKRVGIGVATRQLMLVTLSAAVSVGRLPFGVSPLGFAALGAVSKWDVIGVGLGLLLGLVRSDTPLITLGAYALVLLLRAVFSLAEGRTVRIFGERVSMRIIAATTGALALYTYRLIANELLYYYLFGLILSVVTVALATPLWSVIAGEVKERGYSIWRYVGWVSLSCAVTWGVRGISVYGITLSVLSCTAFTLLTTRRHGASVGGVLGGVSGLCVSVLYAPSFVFCGTVYGLFRSLSPALASALALLVSVAWGAYINGIAALITLTPALMSSVFMFYVIDKLYLSEIWVDKKEAANTSERALAGDIALIRLDYTEQKTKRLCQALSRLSSLLSGKKREAMAEELSFEIGELGGDSRLEEYMGYVNGVLRNEFPSIDYRLVAEYIADASSDGEFFADIQKSEMLTEVLESKYGRDDLVAVAHGKDKPNITVLCDGQGFLRCRCEDIARTLSDLCGYSLGYGEIREADGRAFLTLCKSPLISVSVFGKRKGSSEEGAFCGDSFGVVENTDEGRLFAFISDGMGSGREAARTSELCAFFLEELLPISSAGDRGVDTVLKMLNGFLRGRNKFGAVECASTVDLCVLDAVGCKAQLYKCGAAPTYVFRDGSLFKLRCRTVPIGIVSEVDVGKVELELLPGDVIVMVSDGVTQGREECPQLFKHLQSRLLTHSAEQLATSVVDFALSQGSTDDISVVVIKVSEGIA